MNGNRDLFARCHDGLATPAERERFEAERARSPELAAEFELQRHIDARLVALFAPATRTHAALDLSALATELRAQRRARTWPLALVCTAAAGWLLSWCLTVAPGAARTHDGRTWGEFFAAAEREPAGDITACTSWIASPGHTVLADELPLELDTACSALRASDAGLAGARAWWITCGASRSLVVIGDARTTPPIALDAASELTLTRRDFGPWRCQELARPGSAGALARLRTNAARQ